MGITTSILLCACGPRGAHFSILAAGQNVYQGSTASNKVDILWVIDNSGSMAPKQTNLANGFSSFINVFDSKGFDYQMAVITTDVAGQAGLFQGTVPILTTSTTNLSTEFSTNVNVGTGGAAAAQPFDATLLALSSASLAGANAGFVRSGAHLAIIYVTDADDNDSTTPNGYTDVLTRLSSLKPDIFDVIARTYRKNYTVSAVIADDTKSDFSLAACSSAGLATYENGAKFKTLVNATSGSLGQICKNDFSSDLTTLSQKIAEAITEIPLSRTPDTSTITVTFNGATVSNDATNGWTYDSANNKIVFHGSAIPQDNTNISINYIPNDIIR